MQAGRMTSLLDRLAEIGARPDDTSEDRLRAGALILASIGIAAISCFWIGVYLAYGYESSAAIPFVYQIVTLVGLLALSRTKRFDIFRTTQLAAWLILPALLQITLGGFVASSGMILWAVLVPFAAVALLGVRRAMPWLLAFFVVLAALVLLNPRLAHHPHGFPRSLVVAFIVLNICGLVLGGFVLLGFFVDRSEQARRELAEEQELSEMLLRNMLPDADRPPTKQGEGDRAGARPGHGPVRRHRGVHATQRGDGRRSTSWACSTSIFSAFDTARRSRGPGEDQDDRRRLHGRRRRCRSRGSTTPQAIARTRARDARRGRSIADRRRGGGSQIRIGIDTGPAVAGVIGRRKFIYDLWGDTVNTASRMESHGVPGEIQVTERAAAALTAPSSSRARGPIEVKGKGLVETFFLLGERQGDVHST